MAEKEIIWSKLAKLMPEGFELHGAQCGNNHRNQKNQSLDKKC
jgi:hypothetical protein